MTKARLIAFEMWALRRVLNTIEKSPAPRYKSQLIFTHILNAYRLWHDRIAGKVSATMPWDERSLDECRVLLAELENEYIALANERRAERIKYTNTRGAAFENTLDDILQHVLLHSSYHRGQVNMLIRQAGGEPAVVDYIDFVREKGAD